MASKSITTRQRVAHQAAVKRWQGHQASFGQRWFGSHPDTLGENARFAVQRQMGGVPKAYRPQVAEKVGRGRRGWGMTGMILGGMGVGTAIGQTGAIVSHYGPRGVPLAAANLAASAVVPTLSASLYSSGVRRRALARKMVGGR